MILRKGDMFESGADVIVFTGNSTVRKDGALVMGRGAAREALRRFPGCNKEFGKKIRCLDKQANGVLIPYGVLVHPTQLYPRLVVFQVKYHFKDLANEDLIAFSTGHLNALARTDWRGFRVALNFPGIGWGHLRREDVLPIIETLPDNVEVWEHPE